MRKITRILAVACGLFCGTLSAAEPELAQKEFNGTPYLSGGIGEEELEQINQARKDFNFKLLMAEKSGAYVTGVQVVIVDSKGKKALEIQGAGPLLLAKLPVGAYQVSATFEGQLVQQRMDVRAGRMQSLVFRW